MPDTLEQLWKVPWAKYFLNPPDTAPAAKIIVYMCSESLPSPMWLMLAKQAHRLYL